MAIVGLSEFTFGYGFLYEQTQQHWANLRVAPILPSLAQEADDAWDAKLPLIGTDFYYQFKLSDYLTRRNSLFHRDHTYDAPYYRLAFHRRDRNRQHRRLWQHAQANPQTYYVAPEFNTIADFNAAFLAHSRANHSRLIPLAECEDCDDDEQHYITFQAGDPAWLQHSKQRRNPKSYRGDDLEAMYRGTAEKWRPIDEDFASAAFLRATSAIKQSIGEDESIATDEVERVLPLLDTGPGVERRGTVLKRTAELLSVFIGATMVLVGEAPP